MDVRIEDRWLDRAASLVAAGERRILGLVGAPGAGKSTLAEGLARALGRTAVVVPMDGFHLANVELARLGRADRKGAEDTFDIAGYAALLERLREDVDEVVYAPAFRREIEEPIAGTIPVLPEHRLIITEGNYLLLESGAWRKVRPLIDEVWYVEEDEAVRRRRLVERHIHFGRTPAAAEAWVTATDDPNARLIAATRGRADHIYRLPSE